MLKYGMSVVAAAAALVLSGTAFAADASGNQPYNPEGAGVVSTTTRSAVEAQATKTPPAAGQSNEKALAAPAGTPETRAQVKSELKQAEASKAGFPDASGNQPLGQNATR